MRQLIFLCLFVLFTNNWCGASESIKCEYNIFCYCLDREGACPLDELDGKNVRCTNNGNYEPAQCDEAGTCHCVDPQTGTRLGSYSDSVDNLEQITCKCAIAEFHDKTAEVCAANGNFNAVKCDATQCYCADHNGNVIQDATGNPKYSDDVSNKHDMNCDCAQTEWADPRGTYYCTPYGNYETKVCTNGNCYCYDPEGNPFDHIEYHEAWGGEILVFSYMEYTGKRENLDCRCALAHWYHVNSGAEGHLYEEECDSIGGFRPMQCHDGACFCVDEEGHTIAGEDGQPLYTMDQAVFDKLSESQQPQCECARDKYLVAGKAGTTSRDPACEKNGDYATAG